MSSDSAFPPVEVLFRQDMAFYCPKGRWILAGDNVPGRGTIVPGHAHTKIPPRPGRRIFTKDRRANDETRCSDEGFDVLRSSAFSRTPAGVPRFVGLVPGAMPPANFQQPSGLPVSVRTARPGWRRSRKLPSQNSTCRCSRRAVPCARGCGRRSRCRVCRRWAVLSRRR